MDAVRELAVGQQSLWLLYKLAPTSAAYNDGDAARMSPIPDIDVLNRALRATAERHDILRSCFVDGVGDAGPGAHRELFAPELVTVEVRDVGPVGDARLSELVRDTVAEPFELSRTGALRVVLLRRETDAALVIAAHHIATDAKSQFLLWRDLLEAYRAYRVGEQPRWRSLRGTYDDYVARERSLLDSPRGAEMAAFWHEICAGAVAAELPTDRPRPQRPGFAGATHSRRLPDTLAVAVDDAARGLGVTPFGFLLGIFQSLLHRHTGQSDLSVGCPMTLRRTSALRDVVGLLVNPVVLRARFDPATTLADAVRAAAGQVGAASARAGYPFALLGGSGRAPLFRIAFTMVTTDPDNPLPELGAEAPPMDFAGHQVTFLSVPHLEGQFDLTVEMTRSGSTLTAVFRYDTDLFDEASVVRLVEHYFTMLAAAAARPDLRVSRVSLVDEAQRRALLAMGGVGAPG